MRVASPQEDWREGTDRGTGPPEQRFRRDLRRWVSLGGPWQRLRERPDRTRRRAARMPGSSATVDPSHHLLQPAAQQITSKNENENCSRACCDRQLRISGRTKHEGGQRGHSALQLTAWRQLPGKALVSKFGLAMYRFPTRDRDTAGTGTCRRVCLHHLGPEWADEFQEAAIAEESIKKPWGAAGGARRSDDAIADLGTLPRAAPAMPLPNGF